MRIVFVLVGLWLMTGCAPTVGEKVEKFTPAIIRAVHPGERSKLDSFYTVFPTCESEGYPEITVTTAPKHGHVSSGPGQDYPSFAKDNVRWDCNRKLVPSTEVFYQADAGFQGKDSFSIAVRFPTSGYRAVSYDVEVLPQQAQ